MQDVPHNFWLGGQFARHLLAEQISPDLQGLLHLPQCFTLLERLTQSSPQLTWPLGHDTDAHLPSKQYSPALQVVTFLSSHSQQPLAP